MVWSLWARSVSLVRSALGGGSDYRGPMVVRRGIKARERESAEGLSKEESEPDCTCTGKCGRNGTDSILELYTAVGLDEGGKNPLIAPQVARQRHSYR